jgi:hypothetical protein
MIARDGTVRLIGAGGGRFDLASVSCHRVHELASANAPVAVQVYFFLEE